MDLSTEFSTNSKYRYKRLLISLFIIFFTVSSSVAIISSGILISQGLFSEVKVAVVEQKETDQEQNDIRQNVEVKETIRIFNIWLLIIIAILVLKFLIHSRKAPPHQTLVSIWVRMDN